MVLLHRPRKQYRQKTKEPDEDSVVLQQDDLYATLALKMLIICGTGDLSTARLVANVTIDCWVV